MSDQRDCLARVAYSSGIADAAEDFLRRTFSGEEYREDNHTTIAAAMHVVCGLCWVQPTESQLKAGKLLEELSAKTSPDAHDSVGKSQ